MLVTSSATRQGLDELARELLRRVPAAEPVELEAAGEDEVAEYRVFRPAAGRAFEVEQRRRRASSASPATPSTG